MASKKIIASSKVVQPMDPAWLKAFLSEADIRGVTLKCLTKAFEKYFMAINKAGAELERDLLNCRDKPEIKK